MVTIAGIHRQPKPSPPPLLPLSPVPDHVAVIMDGNGRWARSRGLSRLAGHRAGTENIRRVIQRFADYGVRYLTLYAFSTENWERPRYEVRGLMALLSRFLKRETANLHKEGVRLLHLGDLSPLSPGLQRQVCDAIELTRGNGGMTLAIAFNYGGRAEIIEAVRRVVAAGVPPERIDDQLFSSYLSTAGLPDPDLIIRTAGEMRISNFLLWQGAYAELCFTPVYWPDFDIRHIDDALLVYSQRTRRFGGLLPEEADCNPRPGPNGRSNGHRPDGRASARKPAANGHQP
ncbi:MAG: polyprenyl diphosphate synthase [Dehalococcoidia bacterium]|nr:polyprenyl diphosphate synthase [Dehalococcoidia bacterium]